jgi:hypothetical protein
MKERSLFDVQLNQVIDRMYTLAVTLLGTGKETASLIERVFARASMANLQDDSAELEEFLVREFYHSIDANRPVAVGLDPGERSNPAILLRSIPTEKSLPILLVDFLGWPYSRVARTLGVDVENVQALLAAGRQRLRDLMLRTND